MVKYKYQKPQDGEKIVFLTVIKPPHWEGRPKDICHKLPVGALTWCYERYVNKDENGIYCFRNSFGDEETCVIIEHNRYGINFDSKCFEIQYTSTQKIRR